MIIRDRSWALGFLNGLRLHGLHPTLENVRGLLARMGNPQHRFSSIQIVGSNGKGSTASILAAILASPEDSVGLYTSPHLSDLRERVLLQGEMLSLASWLRALSAVDEAMKMTSLPITFFEAVTCAAFSLFDEGAAKTAVLEAGMGGRWDATSVASPRATVLTSISLEHTQILGDTLEQILAEKAAVGQRGAPFVAKLSEDLWPAFFRHARDSGFSPIMWGRDFSARWISPGEGSRRMFLYKGLSRTLELPISLVADYQIGNVALALATLESLEILPEEEKLSDALLSVRHAGRWERILDSPPVYLDGAHNPEAAESLAQTIGSSFAPNQKVVYLFGVLEDKNWKAVLQQLFPTAQALFLTAPPSSRAVSPEQLKKWVSSVNVSLFTTFGPMEKMLESALEMAKRLSLPLVVAGSLYLVGGVRGILTGALPELPIGEHSPEDLQRS